ncbi:MAG: laminin B domain-containing protein [Planctomycetota bacterium]|nr:laminin B domain-containing protein [Planctomycetota bacterium]
MNHLATITAACAALAITVSASAGAPEIRLISDVCGAQVGDNIEFRIEMIDPGADVVGAQFFLAYDDSRLMFLGAAPGDPPFTVEIYEDSAPGVIDYAVGVPGAGPGVSADTTLAVLTFEVIGDICDAPDLVTFRTGPRPTRLTDDDGMEIPASLTNLNSITLAPATLAAACETSGDFDCSPEGWTAFSNSTNVQWIPSGGPAGLCDAFIAITDTSSGGQTLRFLAGACYAGDRSNLFGGTLRYDYITDGAGGPFTSALLADVQLVGGGLTIEFNVPPPVAPGVWTTYEIPLGGCDWRIDTGNNEDERFFDPMGPAPTQAQFIQVLANLEEIRIGAEVEDGLGERVGVDNIALSPPPTECVTESFDAGAAGWTVLSNTAPAMWSPNGGPMGAGDGYLFATDDLLNLLIFSAPGPFLGDQSSRYDGILQFDLISIGGASASFIPGPLADVQLIGAGLVIEFNVANPVSTNFWTRYQIPLEETAGWRINTDGGDMQGFDPLAPAPTQAQFQSVLANLTALRIGREIDAFSGESVGIDNVEFCDGVPTAICGADLNADNVINSADLAILLGSWGTGCGPADLNFDGVVNSADLGILLGSWGPCS